MACDRPGMRFLAPSKQGGKIRALKCELNPVEHCNLSCASCSHLSPIQSRFVMEPADLERDFTLLSRHYHARWVRLVGGEPLLHPALDELLDAIHSSCIADKIMLVTNGTLLPRLPSRVWERLDRVDVSQYPGAELDENARTRCERTAHRHNVRIYFDRISTFRISYSERGTSSTDLVERIYKSCAIVHEMRCHTVARGYFYKCPQSYFLPRTLVNAEHDHDRVRISDDPSFARELRAFLQEDEPLRACSHCLGTAGRRIAHSQIKRRDFRGPQDISSDSLVDQKYLKTHRVVRRQALATVRHRLGRDAH